MKLLNRYITKELIPPFFVGLGFFTFIFILDPMRRLMDMLVVKRVPLKMVFLLFFYLLPSTIAISLPMASLVAILMAYGRLSSDSEIIAMRACGISYLKIFMPAIIFSFIISLIGVYFNDTLLPKGNFAFIKLYKEIVQMKPTTQLEEHTLKSISGKIIGVDKINKKHNIMYGIIIYEKDNRGGVKTITAERGKWIESKEKKLPNGKILYTMRLMLENGNIQQPSQENLEEFSNIPFKKLVVNFSYEIYYSTAVRKGTREKTTSEILDEIREKEKLKKGTNRLWVEYHKRFSIPFASIAFALLGLPFAIVSRRSGKSVSLGISIVIIFAYYIFYTMGESIGKEGKAPAIVALWIPNIIFMLIGIYFIYKISKR